MEFCINLFDLAVWGDADFIGDSFPFREDKGFWGQFSLYVSGCGIFSHWSLTWNPTSFQCRATRTLESDLWQIQGTGQSASSRLQKHIWRAGRVPDRVQGNRGKAKYDSFSIFRSVLSFLCHFFTEMCLYRCYIMSTMIAHKWYFQEAKWYIYKLPNNCLIWWHLHNHG